LDNSKSFSERKYKVNHPSDGFTTGKTILGFGSTEDPGRRHTKAKAKKANKQALDDLREIDARLPDSSEQCFLSRGQPSSQPSAGDKRNLGCRNLCITPQVSNCGPKLVQLGAIWAYIIGPVSSPYTRGE
jgi:hypothetical protein